MKARQLKLAQRRLKTINFVHKFSSMISSPLTGNKNVKIIDTIPCSQIIALYKQEIGIDVSNYFTNLDEIQIAECTDTGFRFYLPEHIFADGEFYAALNRINAGYYKPDRWEHLKALQLIKPGEKILEVGSGDGAFLKMVSKKGASILGLEINTDSIDYASRLGLTVLPESLQSHAESHVETYDVVASFQVLEHIFEVREYFESALKCLKPGGRIIIGVPNNNPYMFKWEKLHVLNLPPHHSGLWNKLAFSSLSGFFPVHLEALLVEPLQEYGEWLKVQKEHYSHKRSFKGICYSLIPRPLGKLLVRIFSRAIEGRNLLAVLKKTN